ncbi:hypothetical protein EDD98_7126 [Streptomyces sp. PanSC19]|nr:hypothetical protein EDD98_7126 [Streptomyces sp. PanSC19]
MRSGRGTLCDRTPFGPRLPPLPPSRRAPPRRCGVRLRGGAPAAVGAPAGRCPAVVGVAPLERCPPPRPPLWTGPPGGAHPCCGLRPPGGARPSRPPLWAVVPLGRCPPSRPRCGQSFRWGGTGGHNGPAPCRRPRLMSLNPHPRCTRLVVRVQARDAEAPLMGAVPCAHPSRPSGTTAHTGGWEPPRRARAHTGRRHRPAGRGTHRQAAPPRRAPPRWARARTGGGTAPQGAARTGRGYCWGRTGRRVGRWPSEARAVC